MCHLTFFLVCDFPLSFPGKCPVLDRLIDRVPVFCCVFCKAEGGRKSIKEVRSRVGEHSAYEREEIH
jgi:hypothetical protein